MNPTVSLITPFFNAMPYFRDYLGCVLRQTWRPLEWIAVDDGSSDGSWECLAEFLPTLERAGITARVLRSPKSISGEGCSHSVKISQRNLPDALRILQRVGLSPKRVYITAGDGSYQEVAL